MVHMTGGRQWPHHCSGHHPHTAAELLPGPAHAHQHPPHGEVVFTNTFNNEGKQFFHSLVLIPGKLRILD